MLALSGRGLAPGMMIQVSATASTNTVSATTMTVVQRRLFISASFEIHQRNAIGLEQRADPRLFARQHALELLAAGAIAFAHSHGYGITKGQWRETRRVRHRRHRQWYRRTLREIAAQRTPHGGDVDAPLSQRLEQALRRIGPGIVAINHEAADVIDDALLAQRQFRRRVVGSDQVYSDPEHPQPRIGQ